MDVWKVMHEFLREVSLHCPATGSAGVHGKIIIYTSLNLSFNQRE